MSENFSSEMAIILGIVQLLEFGNAKLHIWWGIKKDWDTYNTLIMTVKEEKCLIMTCFSLVF